MQWKAWRQQDRNIKLLLLFALSSGCVFQGLTSLVQYNYFGFIAYISLHLAGAVL